MKPNPIPPGFHTVTPYLAVDGADKVIEFMQKAFDGKVSERQLGPGGKIAHAQVRVGDSIIMISDACAPMKAMPTTLYLYVQDADATYKRAIEAGGKSFMAPTDQFYGDRSGAVSDSAGNAWWIASRIEEVPPEELKKRMAAANQRANQNKGSV